MGHSANAGDTQQWTNTHRGTVGDVGVPGGIQAGVVRTFKDDGVHQRQTDILHIPVFQNNCVCVCVCVCVVTHRRACAHCNVGLKETRYVSYYSDNTCTHTHPDP